MELSKSLLQNLKEYVAIVEVSHKLNVELEKSGTGHM